MRAIHLLAASLVLPAVGCATVAVDPTLFDKQTFVIASVYARRSISFTNVPVHPGLDDNALGTEVIEMTLGDTEDALAALFAPSAVLPVGKALLHERLYNRLPEKGPERTWSLVNDMTPVDVENPAAGPTLGDLARAVGADAAIVLRHEWSIERQTLEVGGGVTAFDRCTLYVVDVDGRVLLREVVLGRVPVVLLAPTGGIGLDTVRWEDEARQLARRSAAHAFEVLRKRLDGARQRGTTPPNG